jgi:hypothetical protein
MLTENQKQILKQIAERRLREGPRCFLDTRAHFYQLMGAALSVDPTMTEEQFLKAAREELTKHLKK